MSRPRVRLISLTCTFPVAIVAFVAVSLVAFEPALAAEEIGSAVTISNRVTGTVGGKHRQLITGNPVFFGERLAAAPNAFGEFMLKDDTKLALGPGARLELNNIVYKRPQGSAQRVWLRLYRGALRFATGFSAKRAYRINAATASIGVRGTLFDVFTARRHTVVLLLHGHMRVCSSRNRRHCRNLRRPCDWVAVDPAGRLRKPRGRKAHEAIGASSVRAFPFLRAEGLLIPGLRGDSLRCLSVAGPPPNTPQPFWAVPGDPTRPGFGFTDPAKASEAESEGDSPPSAEGPGESPGEGESPGSSL